MTSREVVTTDQVQETSQDRALRSSEVTTKKLFTDLRLYLNILSLPSKIGHDPGDSAVCKVIQPELISENLVA